MTQKCYGTLTLAKKTKTPGQVKLNLASIKQALANEHLTELSRYPVTFYISLTAASLKTAVQMEGHALEKRGFPETEKNNNKRTTSRGTGRTCYASNRADLTLLALGTADLSEGRPTLAVAMRVHPSEGWEVLWRWVAIAK